MKKVLPLFLLLAISFVSNAQDSTKIKDIKELMKLTGRGNLGMQVMNTMITQLKSAYKDVPDDFWDKFSKEINTEDIVNLIIPIYDKYYTDEDIKTYIAFYKSPFGQKMLSVTPQILQESMQAGKEWGKKIGQKVIDEMKAEGYDK